MATQKNKKNAPVQLFSKFGEFNSYKELNKAAEGQLADGDIEALKTLAAENGIEEYDVEDYINGDMDELATPLTAAMGRLKVEIAEIKELDKPARIPCMCILEMVKNLCTEESFAKAVMKKGRRIQKIGTLMYESRCLCGTDYDLQSIIKAYYLQGEKAAREEAATITKRYGGEAV